MKDAGTRDVVGGLLGVAALVMSCVQLFTVPMAFAPLALVALVIAIMTSPKYRGLYQVTAVVLGVGFVVGAAIAVITGNPLY